MFYRKQEIPVPCFFSVVVLAVASEVRATDYFVNPGGTNGEFPTVQSAINAVVGQTETDRANIFIAPTTYFEQLTINKPFLSLIGQGSAPTQVIIRFNSTHVPFAPFNAATLIDVSATAFMARNLTFENNVADQNIVAALALESDADRAIFDNVRILGYQDTMLADGRARQYFRSSFVTGDADFIFGNATAVFDQCRIESTDWGYITAADTTRDTANGFIFLDCRLQNGSDRNPGDDGTSAPANSVFLGRPWLWSPSQQSASVIYIRTRMGPQIALTGWDPWNTILDPGISRDPLTRYSEWGSMNLNGVLLPDSNHDGTPNNRVGWADRMTAEQAANYTLGNIFGPVEFWNAITQPETTGVPYTSQGNPWNPSLQLLSLPARPGVLRQLFDTSTRSYVGIGDKVSIGGFIINGVAPKKVIIRALGPSLGAVGLSNVLADPVLELFDAGGTLVSTNDNWVDDPVLTSQLASLGLTPASEYESALVLTLSPGRYTAVVSGNYDGSGLALVEVYDGDLAADSQLANLSTRGEVGLDDNIMIGGFIIGGNEAAQGRVVVRAIGPSLSALKLMDVLDDPLLELKDANGSTLISNDDWQKSQENEIIQTGLAPTDPREAALVTTVSNGNYTAIVRGKESRSGLAVVEIYSIP